MLDEATCYLEPEGERRVEEAFARRRGTVIIVAHRMSSAIRANRVLVLDGARTAVGDHAHLSRYSPAYRDLVGQWNPSGSADDHASVL